MSGIRDFTFSLIKNMTQFSEQWAYRFQAVVDELSNNAIEHGSKKDEHITIIFTAEPQKSIQIAVEDTGTGPEKLNAEQMKKLVAERSQPGYPFTEIRGRGLAKIVAAWTDELKFEDLPNGGLRVSVKKLLKQEANAATQGQQRAQASFEKQDPTHVVLS